ncbi:monocyte to macrophage differentiation factor 2 [Saimiri boliviensis]|uniref:monocyte to macrophage differentiation factor 2 n=1 Tax=Saimiri boliviensis TaxID=27679 RepID=UPI003D77ED39
MFAPRLLDFQKTKYARFMNHRVPAHKRYQPTEYEHAANCATHAFWIIPSILGSSNLYFLSDDDWETISAWIYGFGLCGLFVVSTVFHTISWKKSHLRMVEHCLHMFDRMVIYFFIAASYAPWLNLRELGPWASHMRWLVWIMASVGTIYVFFFHERYKLVELLCYVVMGFFPALVILSMPNTEGIWELMTGGVFYCLGMVFFKSDGRIPFAHAIWHLFVAFGAGTHYYAIWSPAQASALGNFWPSSDVGASPLLPARLPALLHPGLEPHPLSHSIILEEIFPGFHFIQAQTLDVLWMLRKVVQEGKRSFPRPFSPVGKSPSWRHSRLCMGCGT